MIQSSTRIAVNLRNPGHYFACCGLLELADRLNPGAEGYFEGSTFCLDLPSGLPALIQAISTAGLDQLDPSDYEASPLFLREPFNLRLDWWESDEGLGRNFKVWSGTMSCFRIARAMQVAMQGPAFMAAGLLDAGMVVFDPDETDKKVEPFYFDARRGANAESRDIGFSPNTLGMTTTAFPAVEFLTLVGLQRCRPVSTEETRIYRYYAWPKPCPPSLLAAAVAGFFPKSPGYQFACSFRTAQEKHKAFYPAEPIKPTLCLH